MDDHRVRDASMDAVITADHHGRIVRWKRSAELMFGRAAAEVVGRELAETIVPEHLRLAHRTGLSRLAAGGSAGIPGGRTETVGMHANGTLFPVELTITTIADGPKIVFVGFLRDLSESRRVLAALQDSRRRLLTVSDDARRRIERDLHDGAQQQLVGLAIALAAARRKMDVDPAEGVELLDRSIGILASAMEELRSLARGMHSAILTERGLPAAIGYLAGRSQIQVTAVVDPIRRLPAVVETSVYYLIAEALTNATKYGAAHVQVRVELRAAPAGRCDLVGTIGDDGPGGADPVRGTGLAGMTERLSVLGGTVEVDSPLGAGTTIRFVVPISAGE